MSDLDAAVSAGLSGLLDALGAPALASAPARLTALKSKLGRKGVADQLSLTEHELSRFEAALAEHQRWLEAPPAAPRRADFSELAGLAALQWLELLCPRRNVAAPKNPLTSTLTAERAAGRVRALELVVRELIHESYKNQDALVARLCEAFRPDTVEKWKRAAAGADLLVGMSFGDLAGFFVSKEEYPRWQPTLEVDLWLSMLRERRKTLREYLDALRLARNALAHHKPLGVTQLLLVERYSDEIFSPISRSWADGRTAVNPKNHLEASGAGLEEWLAGLTDEVDEIRDELGSVKVELAATKRDVSALEGAVVLVLLSGLFFIGALGFTALSTMTGKLDVSRSGELVAQNLRGMLVAAITFGFAVVRIGLNVTWFRSGGGAGLRGSITGRRGLLPLGVWALLGVFFWVGPFRVSSVQNQYDEVGYLVALTDLDDELVAKALDRGADPNKVFEGGYSALNMALVGSSRDKKKDDEVRRARIVKLLLAKGAKATPADRQVAKGMGLSALLPP